MDEFKQKIDIVDSQIRKTVLKNVIGFLRQNNQNEIADAFYDILSCYPEIPFSKEQREFRLFMAWSNLEKYERNHLVRQIISQPFQ